MALLSKLYPLPSDLSDFYSIQRPDASTLGGEKIARRRMTPPMILEDNHEHELTHNLSIEVCETFSFP